MAACAAIRRSRRSLACGAPSSPVTSRSMSRRRRDYARSVWRENACRVVSGPAQRMVVCPLVIYNTVSVRSSGCACACFCFSFFFCFLKESVGSGIVCIKLCFADLQSF